MKIQITEDHCFIGSMFQINVKKKHLKSGCTVSLYLRTFLYLSFLPVLLFELPLEFPLDDPLDDPLLDGEVAGTEVVPEGGVAGTEAVPEGEGGSGVETGSMRIAPTSLP